MCTLDIEQQYDIPESKISVENSSPLHQAYIPAVIWKYNLEVDHNTGGKCSSMDMHKSLLCFCLVGHIKKCTLLCVK